MSEHAARILEEVATERARQAEIGWTIKYDDWHNVDHLVRLSKARINKYDPAVDEGYYSRKRLVQAAALLVAAIERLDRSEG